MTRKSMTLCASVLALLLCASAFAIGPAIDNTNMPSPSLSVGINGCVSSGTGTFLCQATAFGGSGSYNYWWTHSGSGQLYQTNSPTVTITGCVNGSFTLRVQVLDRVTGQIARSSFYSCGCDTDIFGGGEGFG